MKAAIYARVSTDRQESLNQVAELRFTAFPNNYPHSTVFALDSIQFSDQRFPEPSAVSLFSLTALLLFRRRRKSPRP